MGFGGQSRTQLARRLNAAYATGLLSEDTYVGRLDELMASVVVDPVRVTGDLHLRAPESKNLQRVGDTLNQAFPRLRNLLSAGRVRPPQLLALDWSGATAELNVGRNARCDIVLADTAVSRRHARLRFRDGRWILQDLESKNGSFVNGVRVGRSELRPGDVLMLGDKQLLVD